jgi:hypothetical protein
LAANSQGARLPPKPEIAPLGRFCLLQLLSGRLPIEG